MRSGIALFTGEFIPAEGTVRQAIPMFTIRLLTVYGSRKLFIRIDHHADRIFKLKKVKAQDENYKEVPYLIGLTKEEAEKKIKASHLKLGKVNTAPQKKKHLIGKVNSKGNKPGTWLEKVQRLK